MDEELHLRWCISITYFVLTLIQTLLDPKELGARKCQRHWDLWVGLLEEEASLFLSIACPN